MVKSVTQMSSPTWADLAGTTWAELANTSWQQLQSQGDEPDTSPPPRVTLPRQARWSYVAALTDGTPQHALTAAKSRRLSFALDGPAEASLALDGRGEQAAYVTELTSDLLIYRDGIKMFRGRVGQTQDQLGADAHTVTVQSADYRAMLDRRILLAGDPLGFAQVDQSAIAWTLASASFARTNGGLGITRGIGQTTGVLRDRTYEAGKPCGEAIDQLAEVAGGFEWDVDPELAFNVHYPQRGQDRTDVVLDYGGRIAGLSRSVNPQDFANSIRVSGREASGDTIPPTPAVRTAANIATAPEGRFEFQVGTDLQTTAAVAQRADYELTQRSQVRPSYTVTLSPGAWTDQGSFWLGDTVRLVVMSGRLAVDTTARVHEISFDISEDSTETVSVTLGHPRRDLLQRLRRVQTRLSSLERR